LKYNEPEANYIENNNFN